MSSIVNFSDQPRFCGLEFSKRRWSWIRPSWGFLLLRHSLFSVPLLVDSLEYGVSTMGKFVVGCTTSFSSVLDILSGSCLFFSVVMLAFSSLRSKNPQTIGVSFCFWIIVANQLMSLRLSRLTGYPHFLVQVTIQLEPKVTWFCDLLSSLHQPKIIGVFVSFDDYNHNVLVCPPLVTYIQNLLFYLWTCKFKIVNVVYELRTFTI